MKKNKRGFTLIELLAVIVILGLLMSIAIPSVTRYITQSRRKTLAKTIDSYIAALALQVNDGDYSFTETTTAMGGQVLHYIYAIPIECIALEKGGTNPFGEWMQANNAYWAYVLVQYDSENYSYNYGFTFKDTAGYGMYPTRREEIEASGSVIRQDLDDLNRPTSGSVQNTVNPTKWKGFNITNAYHLEVLTATSEGEVAKDNRTCTLQQKGSNYDAIEQDREIQNNKDDYTIYAIAENETKAFWQYKSKIKSVKFETSINIPASVANNYKWDISVSGNGKVMAYVTPNAADSSCFDLVIQGDGAVYANQNSSYIFDSFTNLDRIDLTNFDTSGTTDMVGMFYKAGYNSTAFTFNIGNKFDTSNAINMNQIFNQMGYSSKNFTLNLGDKFDTSKVTDMYKMFYNIGYSNPNFTLTLGNKFNTGKVLDMRQMFGNAGYNSSSFNVNCSGWDVSKVTRYDNFYTGPAGKITLPNWSV